MRLITWNINGLNARIEQFVKFLESVRPDVICLQEIKCEDKNFPEQQIADAGYFSSFWGQKSYNGVAVISRVEPQEVRRGFGDDKFDDESRLIEAVFEDFSVFSAYVPNGREVGHEKYHYKLEWLKRAAEHLRSRKFGKKKWSIIGDFNVAPDDRDVYSPEKWRDKILCSELEREALTEVLESMDEKLVDTFRMHDERAGQYSWWDYRAGSYAKGNGLRIDFIFASPSMASVCTTSRVLVVQREVEKPSDHAPVLAEFSM